MRTPLLFTLLETRSKVLLTALLVVSTFMGIQAQTLISPTGTWQVRNTISGRYEVKLAGAAVLMPSNVSPYTTCQGATEKNNDEQNRPYADVDGDGSTFQSSTSTIPIPADVVCGHIEYAFLYWGGGMNSGTQDIPELLIPDADLYTCKIKDKDGVYNTVTADFWYKTIWDGSTQTNRDAYPYVCYKNVSSLFHGMTGGGTFTVGNVTTVANDNPTGGQLGGWTLILVYEDDFYTYKNIKFWENMVLAGTSGVNPNTVTLTPVDCPTSGVIDGYMGLMSMDADADKTHTVEIKSNGTGGGSYLPVDNGFPQFFASAIAENGIHIPKNMSCSNTLGWDAQHISLPSGTIKPSTSTVDLKYTTSDEVSYLFSAYIGVQIREARLEVTKTSSTPTALFSQQYSYTIDMANVGGLPTYAGSAYVLDTIDLPVDYVNPPVPTYTLYDNVGGHTHPGGIIVTYTSGTRELKFTNLPSIPDAYHLSITYTVQVKPDTEVDTWRLDCMTPVRNMASVHYQQDVDDVFKTAYSNAGVCGRGDYTLVNITEDLSAFDVADTIITNLGAYAGIADKNMHNHTDTELAIFLTSIGSSLTSANFEYYTDAAMTVPLDPATLFTATPTNQYVYAKRIGLPVICSESFTFRFIIGACVNPGSRTITPTNVTCNGGSDGALDVSVVAPTEGPMKFMLLSGTVTLPSQINSGNTLSSTGNISEVSGSYDYAFAGLPIGTYTIASIDGMNCYFFNTVTLTQPAPIVVNLIATAGCSVGSPITFSLGITGGPAAEAGTVDLFRTKWYGSTNGSTWTLLPTQIDPNEYVVVSNEANIYMKAVASSTTAACDNVVCSGEDDDYSPPSYATNTTEWTALAGTAEWNTAGNWTDGIPTACSNVIIPDVRLVNYYPTILTSGICDTITFEPGGGVLGLEKLDYNAAIVQAELQREKWYTLTAPLKEIYAGDYGFSGVPVTQMQLFDRFNPDSTANHLYTGTWTRGFASPTVKMDTVIGFAYVVRQKTYNYPTYPYFHNDATSLTLTFPRLNADGTLKEIYEPYSTYSGMILCPTYVPCWTVTKNDFLAYRFAAEDGSNQLVDVSYPLAAGLNIVGNPMMTHLDFHLLQNDADNINVIYDKVKFWNGTTFTSYRTGPEISSDLNLANTIIPPMQAFFVERKAAPGSLTIKTPEHFVADRTTSGGQLKSASVQENVLHIVADNGKRSSTAVALRAEASNDSGEEDVFKLFTQFTEVPEVFTLAEGRALDINLFNKLPYTTPLGIKTTSTGNIPIQFLGAESFTNAEVYLVNTQNGTEQNLKEIPTYEFNYDGANGEGALFVEFRSAGTVTDKKDATNAAANIQIYTKDGNIIRVISSPSDLIKEISVFNEVGKLITKQTGLNLPMKDIVMNSGEKVCLVRVVTENTVKVGKVMIY